MTKLTCTLSFIVTVSILVTSVSAAEKTPKGETLFKEKCASCHPEGGNIINAQKTLKKKDLAKNKLNGSADIVKYLRKPGPGMPAFDSKGLPDKDAKTVADYILKTFK